MISIGRSMSSLSFSLQNAMLVDVVCRLSFAVCLLSFGVWYFQLSFAVCRLAFAWQTALSSATLMSLATGITHTCWLVRFRCFCVFINVHILQMFNKTSTGLAPGFVSFRHPTFCRLNFHSTHRRRAYVRLTVSLLPRALETVPPPSFSLIPAFPPPPARASATEIAQFEAGADFIVDPSAPHNLVRLRRFDSFGAFYLLLKLFLLLLLLFYFFIFFILFPVETRDCRIAVLHVRKQKRDCFGNITNMTIVRVSIPGGDTRTIQSIASALGSSSVRFRRCSVDVCLIHKYSEQFRRCMEHEFAREIWFQWSIACESG
jgi:hypothetical protein